MSDRASHRSSTTNLEHYSTNIIINVQDFHCSKIKPRNRTIYPTCIEQYLCQSRHFQRLYQSVSTEILRFDWPASVLYVVPRAIISFITSYNSTYRFIHSTDCTNVKRDKSELLTSCMTDWLTDWLTTGQHNKSMARVSTCSIFVFVCRSRFRWMISLVIRPD